MQVLPLLSSPASSSIISTGCSLFFFPLTVSCERVPDLDHEFSETGSLIVIVGPAAGHERVESRRTVVWFGQPDALLQLVDHISVFQPEKWLLTATHDLPHTHSCNTKTETKTTSLDVFAL